ncbi:trimeric intracellular cation channel family protein [Bradyrhizobium sp. sBnM-33]|uniref:trimeric intracellular cation channel family protein n=1 Tax=Bradyrhizobium sp. sBnM-33 TaxID=2831780 RepID=UPI0020BFD8EE|nr:trimeric intracellular cation channel family protein [Bradyrhizobium sp. sBnM-33]WOH53267.1 trimeric intracellular cation channel family protein [Bradyrhizobium sp. sBnM-33]
MNMLLLVLDLIGTFVFALSGATAAVKRRLDLFGVLVLSFVAGNFGGITRDLMIGAVPPAAISDWRYLAVSLLAGVLTFCWFPGVDRWHNSVLLFDAAGLALFAVSGTQKALALGLNPVMAALLGMVTGIGGGMARDVLVAEIPTVLRADLLCCRRFGRCGGGGCRQSVAHSLNRDNDCRGSTVLWTSPDGDPSRVATPDCPSAQALRKRSLSGRGRQLRGRPRRYRQLCWECCMADRSTC